jgi:hypothetical protein
MEALWWRVRGKSRGPWLEEKGDATGGWLGLGGGMGRTGLRLSLGSRSRNGAVRSARTEPFTG